MAFEEPERRSAKPIKSVREIAGNPERQVLDRELGGQPHRQVRTEARTDNGDSSYVHRGRCGEVVVRRGQGAEEITEGLSLAGLRPCPGRSSER